MVLFNEVWDRRRRGLGSSIIQASIAFGIGAASVVGVWAVGAYGADLGWRIALFTGASPVLLMIYVRFAMPESRLWTEYDRRRKAGELPPQKAAERSALIEIFRGASLRYLILGTIAWGAYVIMYQSVTVFMPVLMTKTLGATPGVVRSATLVYSAFLSAWMLVLGWYSDRGGRRSGVFITTLVSIVGFIGLYVSAAGAYPGSLWTWPLFWWYLVWAVGQTAAAMYGPWLSEQYPVELRSTAVATVYTLGRGIGALAPVVVPLIAAAFHGDLRTGMAFGLLGNLVTLAAIRFLPETAGRQFNVIEDKQVEETRSAVLAEQPATP
jgi:MFS family permease